MYRQGDLLFLRSDKIAGEKTHGLDVLHSTVTGHSHSLTRGEVYLNNPSWQDKGNFYVVIPEGGADLVHPEHDTIKLPAGIYEVRRQREVNGYVQD